MKEHHHDNLMGGFLGFIGGTGVKIFLANAEPMLIQLSIMGIGAVLSSGLGFLTTYLLKKFFKDKNKDVEE